MSEIYVDKSDLIKAEMIVPAIRIILYRHGDDNDDGVQYIRKKNSKRIQDSI
ncbi:MAG: hypothetical protein LUE14_12155 [Clostridiales bacterium]|nr:hypothetical protein [Clostridiales bacterium]